MIWLLGIGGSIGAVVRYLFGQWMTNRFSNKLTFPFNTWIINLSGSLLLGLLANMYVEKEINDWIWYFFGIGFCGAYTTFSTFGMEVITLLQAKNLRLAVSYIVTSIILGLLFAAIGYFLF